jgi:radical SAM superfamily enzyme YgiQ (UPF0313 family)
VTRIALLGLSPAVAQGKGETDEHERRMLEAFPSYGVRRVQAAVVADGRFRRDDVLTIERRDRTAEELATELLAFDPDVVGLALYIWSTPTMIAVARLIRAARPAATIIFGGPSAHTALLDLEPYAGTYDYVDALVIGEGEETFVQICALRTRDAHTLATVDGVAIPLAGGGWHQTPKRVPNPDMDSIASPYQLGLMEHDHAVYVETFRGCPLSCTFCQWGVLDANRFLSTAQIARELQAMKNTRAPYAFIIDAALNLHPRAFRNLAAAEKEVGFFRETPILTEVYPALLREEHLEFLRGCRAVHLGVGVQSLDEEVLQATARPFKPERLQGAIDQFLEFGVADVEIILGLPGDTPERFRRTLDRLLEMPCSVRVYKCLVLPDGLMSRAPAGSDVRFDPLSLELRSCSTWSERDLRAMHDTLDELALTHPYGSTGGAYWWMFVGAHPRCRQAYAHLAPARAVAGNADIHPGTRA